MKKQVLQLLLSVLPLWPALVTADTTGSVLVETVTVTAPSGVADITIYSTLPANCNGVLQLTVSSPHEQAMLSLLMSAQVTEQSVQIDYDDLGGAGCVLNQVKVD